MQVQGHRLAAPRRRTAKALALDLVEGDEVQHGVTPGEQGGEGLDLFVGVTAVIAFIAMQRFKLGLLPIIGICAALGLAKHLIFLVFP